MIISKKYEVLSQLGEGGMGVVYKVRHTALETISALKVLSTHFGDHPDLVKRFYREARVLARLTHPNIVRVIDIERDEELKFYYFVMEFIKGETLRDRLTAAGSLSVAQILAVARQVAGALHYAHSYQPPVIHRDIKPTNIMIEDGSNRVVVMDFGIAKDLGEMDMTRVGTMLGTLRYAPPEQLRHETLDGSTDVYALGMVMYEGLMGQHPFANLTEYLILDRILSRDEHEFEFSPGTPAPFADLVTKAIRKDRSRRYRTMAELLADIDACLVEIGEAAPGVPRTLAPIPAPAPIAEGEPTEIATAARDDKIRELQEPRRRQQIRMLEERVAEEKTDALRQGAADLVPALFQAACAAEDLALAQAKGDQFGAACESLEEALVLFEKAAEKAARAGLARQAGEARAETAAAKTEADRYGATERARTVYRNGLLLQAKADALWENQSYREAREMYGEARNHFQDAQGLAHRAFLTDEANTAQAQARGAREAAIREGVEEHAADAFWEAVRGERRADTLIGQGELASARDLYRAAAEQYAVARQEAQRERRRRVALVAQAEAQASRQALALLAGAAEDEAYRQGQAAQHEGDVHLAAESYEAARAVHAEARKYFEQTAASCHRRMAEEVQARAVRSRADEYLREDFEEALDRLARAVAKEQAGEYVAAADAYREATERWSRLAEDAERLLAQEQAEAARERLNEVQAQGAALRAWGRGVWAHADRSTQEAERAWQERHYAEAIGLFEAAIRAYAEAGAAAEAARDAQQVAEARAQAEQAERAARASEAPKLAQALFAQATASYQNGTRSDEARHWEDARRHYVEAQRLYREGQDAAERNRARATAEAALEGARAARAALQQAAAPETFSPRIEQAEALYAKARTALRDERFEDARAAFDQSATRFRQLREEAVVHQAREAAIEACNHARRLDHQIGDAGGWRMGRAKRKLAEGHRLFNGTHYAEARASFEKAASQFEVRLRQIAARQRRKTSWRLAVPWAKIVPSLALGALAVGAAVYLMRTEREPTPPQPSVSMVPETTVQPPAEPAPPPPAPLRLKPRPEIGTEIPLAEGESRTFSIEVEGSGSRSLRYAWFLDDVPQASRGQTEGPSWTYTPDFDAAGETPKKIKIVVSDASAREAEVQWAVSVSNTNRPPRLAAATPVTENIEAKPGETIHFTVKAEDPDKDDSVAYVWSLDGARVGEGDRYTLEAGPWALRRRVELAAVDRAGLSERRTWEIAVQAPAPLAIRAATPKLGKGQELVLVEGQSQTFSIEIAGGGDRAALRYAWRLDGKQVATGDRWTYKATAPASKTRELRVVVSGGSGSQVEHLWRIRVDPANRPPAIVRSTPGETRIEIGKGDAQRFTVEATDKDEGDALEYRWLLDGRTLAEGSAWEMDSSVPAGQHRVEVKVSDRAGQSATQRWTVAIAEPPEPPSITAVQPAAQRITAEEGGTLEFSADAKLSGKTRKGRMSYEWQVDKGPIRSTTAGQFRLPPLAPGPHTLSVVAVNPDGQKSAPRDWAIELKPKATKTVLAESEVRDWLAMYRRAWEGKDVDRLVELGEVTRDRASQLREVLGGYDDLRVGLKDVTIRIDGDSARITFRREDTIDGKLLPQPGLKDVLLQKQADGRLTRRK